MKSYRIIVLFLTFDCLASQPTPTNPVDFLKAVRERDESKTDKRLEKKERAERKFLADERARIKASSSAAALNNPLRK